MAKGSWKQHEKERREDLIAKIKAGEVINYENKLKMCDLDSFRKLKNGVFLVDTTSNGKIYLQKPDGKTEYDFNVWIVSGDEVKMPKHAELFKAFENLRQKDIKLADKVFKMVVDILANCSEPDEVIDLKEASKIYLTPKCPLDYFLKSLKWVSMQEECNYPSSSGKLGKRMPIAGYLLINSGYFTASEVLRILVYGFRR